MLSDNLDIEVLPKIKLPYKTFATITFVSGSRAGNGRPAIGELTRRGFADHSVEADALHTKFAGVKPGWRQRIRYKSWRRRASLRCHCLS